VCNCRVGKGTVVGLVCGLDIARCVMLEWEEFQCLASFGYWIMLAVKW
jgi:hypothetical protein